MTWINTHGYKYAYVHVSYYTKREGRGVGGCMDINMHSYIYHITESGKEGEGLEIS